VDWPIVRTEMAENQVDCASLAFMKPMSQQMSLTGSA
jgi:hypothetical protein